MFATFAKKAPKLTACLIASLCGAVGVLAYSPFDHWYLAYVSAFGLIWAVNISSRKTALWATFAWSLAYFGVGVNWVSVSMTQFGGVPEAVSYLAVGLLAAYLAIYNLLFCFISHRFSLQSPWALAAIFTFTEYLRGVVFTGFPWLQFGYSQIDSPFASLAQIVGVEGLSFFVMLVSGYFYRLFCQIVQKSPFSATQNLIPSFAILLLAFASQWLSWVKPSDQSPLTVSLVQGNIEQKMKWDMAYFNYTLQTYDRLITPLLGKSDLIILPESAIPAEESQIEPLLQSLQQQAMAKGSELIIGTLYQQADNQLFNSAVVLANPLKPYQAHQAIRYNKHHLVPFGEYVPFGHLLDMLREVFILPINLSQGEFLQSPLLAKNQRFNLAICYEIIFGDQVQKNQQQFNADYLLTISNDAWFGASIGPWQHFQIARMRALELGKPLIRATNTGITAFVDGFGKVIAQAPQFESTTLTVNLTAWQGKTPFSQFGHLPIYCLSLLILAFHFARKVRTH